MGDIPAPVNTQKSIVDNGHHDAARKQEEVLPEQKQMEEHNRTSMASSSQHQINVPPLASQLGPTKTSTPPQQQRLNTYDMTSMTQALPHGNFRPSNYSSPSQFSHTNAPHMMQPISLMQQYGNQGHMPVSGGQPYYLQQSGHMGYHPGQVPMPATQQQPSLQTTRESLTYYQNPMMVNPPHSPQFYYPQANHYHGHVPSMTGPMMQGHYPHRVQSANELRGNIPSLDPQSRGFPGKGAAVANAPRSNRPQGVATDDMETQQGTVRGPPRKPKQSGHAIWIGNLPPQTDLMSLVHHVCMVAPGLESLFLIAKSNCAFANFKDETKCATAQQQLHDSKFQSVRLVSRLRKNTVESTQGIPAPTGPSSAASAPQAAPPLPPATNDSPAVAHDQQPSEQLKESTIANVPFSDTTSVTRDKFFILKSLTGEDLELSVQTGVWATQAHNENALNSAYKTAENVYLVFSANKSGEYFGYARMASEINEDPAAAVEFAPKLHSTNSSDLPKATTTEATEFAPKGRIIDDSARGTIFWEAEREDDELSDVESDAGSAKSGTEGDSKTWGKPFKLEWLSTTHLPFYRTRGLRNPWNSNREVKIARDGTELEPTVGRKLIGLFNRTQTKGVPLAHVIPQPPVTMGVVPGYQPSRPNGPP